MRDALTGVELPHATLDLVQQVDLLDEILERGILRHGAQCVP